MKDHLIKMHPDKSNKDLYYFKHIKNNISSIKKALYKPNVNIEKGLKLSYKLALIIAKTGKPHTIGETLIKPIISKILKETDIESRELLKSIPLNNDTI